MERCDGLYGVAMEEKGVSKMLSVELKDVSAEAMDVKRACTSGGATGEDDKERVTRSRTWDSSDLDKKKGRKEEQSGSGGKKKVKEQEEVKTEAVKPVEAVHPSRAAQAERRKRGGRTNQRADRERATRL